jgi:hypothetical protein
MKWILYVVLGVLVVTALVEVGILVYAYVTADEVKCNFIWCEFTTTRQSRRREISQECFVNNIRVNCTEVGWE